MVRPSISDYVDFVGNFQGSCRTLTDFRVVRDVWGVPEFVAGNSGVVFRCAGGRFLKFYVRPNRHLRVIYDYVERIGPELLPEARLLRDEFFVHTAAGPVWVDAVEGRWSEGETLATAAARAARQGNQLIISLLSAAFDAMWDALKLQEWAHGDLKPENIIVPSEARGGSSVPRLTLVDCDAMWIPSLKGEHAAELGTPPWRDEGRTSADFDKRVDEIPALRIAQALHELAENPDARKNFTTFEELSLSLRL